MRRSMYFSQRLCVVVLAVLVTALPASASPGRILAPMDWWPVWAPDAAHIAFTRVYLRAHYLTDVLGGVALGVALWSLIAIAVIAAGRRSTVGAR